MSSSSSSSKPRCTSSHRSNTPALVPPRLKSFDCWCPSCRSCSKVCGAKRRLMTCYSTLALQKLPSAAERLHENGLTCRKWLTAVHLEKHPTSPSSNTHWMEGTCQIMETPLKEQRSWTAPWQDIPAASAQLWHPLKGPFRGSTGNRQPKPSKNWTLRSAVTNAGVSVPHETSHCIDSLILKMKHFSTPTALMCLWGGWRTIGTGTPPEGWRSGITDLPGLRYAQTHQLPRSPVGNLEQKGVT